MAGNARFCKHCTHNAVPSMAGNARFCTNGTHNMGAKSSSCFFFNASRGRIESDPAAVDFRLLALHASRGCAEIAGPAGFEPGTFLAAQPKLCARPLGQAGAAGVWGAKLWR